MTPLLFDFKTCKTCGESLPTTEFHLSHTRPGALRGSCIRCERDKLKNTKAYDKCSCGNTKKCESEQCIRCNNLRNTYDPDFEKTCSKCNRRLKAVEFGWRMHRGIKRIRTACRECAKEQARLNREKHGPDVMREKKKRAEKRSRERKKTDESYRLARIRASIRLSCKLLKVAGSHEEIAMMYDFTTRCWICDRIPQRRRLHVDHCHKTNRFRGFLCSDCNTGLGQFKDDCRLLENAIKYLTVGIGPTCRGEQ